MVEKRYKVISAAVLILIKQSADKKPRFLFLFEKNAYHAIPIYGNCMTTIFLMTTQKFFRKQF